MRGRKRPPSVYSVFPWHDAICDARVVYLRDKLSRVVSPKRKARYERQLNYALGLKMVWALTGR